MHDQVWRVFSQQTPEQHIEARKRAALENSKKREVLDVEQFDAKAGAASLVAINGSSGSDAKVASASSNGASASSPIDIDEDEDGEVQVIDASASSPVSPAKAKSPPMASSSSSPSLSSPASMLLETTFHPLSIHVKFPPLNGALPPLCDDS